MCVFKWINQISKLYVGFDHMPSQLSTPFLLFRSALNLQIFFIVWNSTGRLSRWIRNHLWHFVRAIKLFGKKICDISSWVSRCQGMKWKEMENSTTSYKQRFRLILCITSCEKFFFFYFFNLLLKFKSSLTFYNTKIVSFKEWQSRVLRCDIK